MKYLKTKNISKFSINDRTLIAYPKGNGPGNRIVMTASGGLMLPKGTTAERPQPVNTSASADPVRQPTDANGTIRYNTTSESIEAYIGDSWVTVASSLATAVTREKFGPGDGVEIYFGPLDPAYATAYAASDHSVLVLVENVMQIGDNENYSLVQNPPGVPSAPFYSGVGSYPPGYYIRFESPVPATGSGLNEVFVTVFHGYSN